MTSPSLLGRLAISILMEVSLKTLFILAISLVSFSSHAFKFDIEYVQTSTTDQERFERLKAKVEELTKTESFKDKVVRYNNYSCFNSSNLPQGVNSTQDVLNHLETATAKIKIKFFSASPNILGSTSGNTISFNVNNFATRLDKEVANTLFHESLHTMGYGHCGKNNIRLFPKIKRSIPYKLGDFIESLY